MIEFGGFGGFANPITAAAPLGTIVNVKVTAFDKDVGSRDELIGLMALRYVVGSPGKTVTSLSGTAALTVSVYL